MIIMPSMCWFFGRVFIGEAMNIWKASQRYITRFIGYILCRLVIEYKNLKDSQ